ncbi:lateral flagellar assembly protein FliH [Oceanimonas sp. GK1]|uniref:FliH/SctL family protein n=1 Tax=Oceanimonas sp. (strain GK1 / IBRC-M 10197) TaxID=511062 RepID=UPI0002495696|nr:FliH/SctL family protein [Oceanimonas sp. GK1]AEY02565.1 lateral flagellar assembly protein FliH [Oceanimonas sp. GK1]
MTRHTKGALAYRRYRFPPLYGEPSRHEATEQEEPAAYSQGLEQGYEEGFGQGHAAGLERGRQEGLRLGLEQGTEQGRQQGLAQLRELQHSLAEELRQWQSGAEQQWQQLSLSALRQQREQLCELVEQVARRVIRTELTLNPQQVLAIVEEALAGIDARTQELQLFVNPDDCARLREIGITECQGWALHEDAALAPGDCRIETETLTLEALTEERLQKGMARVAQSLDGADEPA